MVFVIGFPIVVSRKLLNYVKTKDKNFKIMWEALIDGLQTNEPSKILYNFYLYLRKILFSLIIVFLHGYTMA